MTRDNNNNDIHNQKHKHNVLLRPDGVELCQPGPLADLVGDQCSDEYYGTVEVNLSLSK